MTVRSAALLGIGGDGRRRNRTAELLPTIRQEPTAEKRSSIADRKGDPVPTSSGPPHDEVRGQASSANATTGGKKKRPIAWMVVAGVAVLAAIGLGVWAVKIHSDLEDQRAATQAAEAQAAAQADAAAAVAAEVDKINASNEIFVVSDEDVAQAESEVAAAEDAAAEASSAVSAAQDEASKLRAELDQARAERDLARAERQQARVCARGSLGVISSLGKSDEQAAQEMQTVSSACVSSASG